MTKIKKGSIWLCIKDVVMDTNILEYKKGNTYHSEQDDCITDESGCIHHSWKNINYLDKYFIKATNNSKVEHPSHYTWLKDKCGIEVIDITRHMDFDLGNAIKYILRAGHKSEKGYSNKAKTIEDLKKAIFYINDKINTLK